MAERPNFDKYFSLVQKTCPPGIWSKAVALAREYAVTEDSSTPEEISLRIVQPHRPISPKVTLWPTDEDWHCNCGDRQELCVHIAASVIAIKSGLTQVAPSGKIEYRLTRQGDALHFDRVVQFKNQEVPLTQSLVSFVGGLGSGRINAAAVAATQEDFAVDAALLDAKSGIFSQGILTKLFKVLARCSNILLDGLPVQISGKPAGARLTITEEREGVRIQISHEFVSPENPPDEIFSNGAFRKHRTLYAVAPDGLTAEERVRYRKPGLTLSSHAALRWTAEVLPSLQKRIPLERTTITLPELIEEQPRIILETQSHHSTNAPSQLTVLPVIVYGNPPIARIEDNQLIPLVADRIPARNPQAEQHLSRALQNELHLTPGQLTIFSGLEVSRFLSQKHDWEIADKNQTRSRAQGTLKPEFHATEQGFELRFGIEGAQADPAAVLGAWKAGYQNVPLLDGGWAALPHDWLDQYGHQIAALLTARDPQGKIPKHRLPELVTLCQDQGQDLPASLEKLKAMLANQASVPDYPLPQDLTASLREYQRQGVRWLKFLREAEMGAMLADDMGLGKTLQVLTTLQTSERILIVAPTSVLGSWQEQAHRFRPELKLSLYHGSNRSLPPGHGIVLTSYALLRLDQDRLCNSGWDLVVLDESQIIRNPESQVAQAAHRISAHARLALTGTPIENRLDDLWSQFQFLNPGVLGSKDEFRNKPFAEIHRRIRPFILRRLKKEVAAELPPRIETLLQCELSDSESALYRSILAASKTEVLKTLKSGGSLLSVLETLLRLRQACCHPSLVPGQSAATSSKIEVLLETLDTSLSESHKSLIFSQWTTLLDLVEPHLIKKNISHLRIDGTTTHRQAIIDKFQDPAGPPVLLMSLKAGGLGLTLTAADHVFLLDPWWNPAAENQAADRAHRIGQTNSVVIHRLVATNTIEEKVLTLQARKSELAESIMRDNLEGLSKISSITRDEILSLFGE